MVAINGESYGYPGTIDSQQWAEMQRGVGQEYWVNGDGSAKVTALGSAARTVRIAGGLIAGHGVFDRLDAPVDLVLTNPASGTVYYPIYARRTWQTTNATTFVAGAAQTSRVFPPSRNESPGVIDDQPLALVQVTRNQNDVVVVEDLRATGSTGNLFASSSMVLQYMTKPGYRVRIDNVEWLRAGDSTWIKNANLPRSGWQDEGAPETSGTISGATRRLHGVAFGVKDYPRIVRGDFYGELELPTTGTWRIDLMLVDASTPYDDTGGTTVCSQTYGSGSGGARHPVHVAGEATVPAGDNKGFRIWLKRIAGSSSAEFADTAGRAMRTSWTEISNGNQW